MYIPKKTRSLHKQVTDKLGQAIVDGKFEVGSTLPTAEELSIELGVSRTVTREAIKVLEEKGLVISRPKTGIHVQPSEHWKLLDTDVMLWQYNTDFSPELLANLIEVRRIIEPAASRLAAKQSTQEDIETITLAYLAMERNKRNIDRYREAEREFHYAVYDATHNPLLIHLAKSVSIDLGTARLVSALMRRSTRTLLAFHKDILAAIHTHDAVKAHAVTLLLVNQTAAYMAAALSLRQRNIQERIKLK